MSARRLLTSATGVAGMMSSGMMGSGGRGDHLAHHPVGTGMWS